MQLWCANGAKEQRYVTTNVGFVLCIMRVWATGREDLTPMFFHNGVQYFK